MPTRDNFSNQIVTEALGGIIEFNGITYGNIIDTAGYTGGIKFAFVVITYLAGTHVLSFEEGNDPALSDAVAVDSEKIIGNVLSFNAVTVATDPWPGNGLFSTKRYVRAVVTSTGAIVNVDLEGVAVLSGEYNPQDQ